MNSHFKFMTNDEIYRALKEDILNLRLVPGQMISENEISKKYSVSRTPVKTAFLRLMSEKFIEIVPQKGSFVTLLDLQFIKDIIYMRTILEREIIKTVIEDFPDWALDKLRANLAVQNELISAPMIHPEDFYAVDSEFHGFFFELADRLGLWNIIQESQLYYTRFRMLDIMATGRFAELYKEHLALFTCIEGKDMETFSNIIHDHLHGNLRILADRIDNEFKDYFV